MKIAIDPGHGNGNRTKGVIDSGAVSGQNTEAQIVTAWALTLGFVLDQADIPYWYTRDDMTDYTPLGTRASRAMAAGCTVFLSIHCNSFNGKASGCETFYRDEADKGFAVPVQKSILKATGLPDRGVKSEGSSQHNTLKIFDFRGMAALTEIGFLDNPFDISRLLSRDVRLTFAEGIRDWAEAQRKTVQ